MRARTIIVLIGVTLTLVAFDVPRKLAQRRSDRNSDAADRHQHIANLLYGPTPWYKRLFLGKDSSPRRKQLESDRFTEREVDSFHNRRMIPLRIEFSNNDVFKHVAPPKGRGIVHESQPQTYRVAVYNTTAEEICGVQVLLNDISPRPQELMGHGPIPLHITHEAQSVHTINLAPQQRRFVDVVTFLNKFWDCHVYIQHTSSIAQKEIYIDEDGYEIELLAKGDKVPSSRRRFKICVIERQLYMKSLEQPEQEAFEEAFNENYREP